MFKLSARVLIPFTVLVALWAYPVVPQDTEDAAAPVTVIILRNAGETFTVYVPGEGIVSLEGMTFEITNGDQIITRTLDGFPSLGGFRFDAVVLPACFHFAQSLTRQPVPVECQQNVPVNQVQLERISVPFWFDVTFQQPYLVTVTNGLDIMGTCPAQQLVCTFEYTPAEPIRNPNVPEDAVVVVPLMGTLVVQGETRFRAAPSPEAELIEVRTAGTFDIVGVNEEGNYYQVDLNGAAVWVSASALNATAKLDEDNTQRRSDAARVQGEGPHDLVLGETVRGVLAEGETARFEFVGLEGEEISIIVDAEFDSTLALYSNSLGGVPLIEVDDSGGTDDPRVDGLILQADDTYLLDIGGFSTNEAGTYEVTLRRGALDLDATNQVLVPGERITANLEVSGEGVHCFEGTGGETVSLRAEALFDTYLQLEDSDRQILASDDESGGEGNPFIRLFELPYDDTFCAVIRSFDPSATGAYRLTLNTGLDADAVGLSNNEVVTATLDDQNQILFSFKADSGERVSIFIESDFDALLELRDETGALLTSDDDSGGNLQPAITEYTLPLTGTYFVIVSTFGEVEDGTFTVTFAAR